MAAIKITDVRTGKVTYPKGVPVPVAARKPMLTSEERRQRGIQRGKEIQSAGFSMILCFVFLGPALIGVAMVIGLIVG